MALIGLSVIIRLIFERPTIPRFSDDFRRRAKTCFRCSRREILRAASQRSSAAARSRPRVSAPASTGRIGAPSRRRGHDRATQLASSTWSVTSRSRYGLGTTPRSWSARHVIGIIRSCPANRPRQAQRHPDERRSARRWSPLRSASRGHPGGRVFNFFQRIIRARPRQADTLSHELLACLRGEKSTHGAAE